MHYDYEYVDANPPESRVFQVTDPNVTVRIKVFDRSNRLRRLLYEGQVSPGPLSVQWDLKDSFGVPVPSGIYTVQFTVGAEVKQSYTVTVSGAVTARTDSLGSFAIMNENLPIGFYPVPLYSSDRTSFLGNYRIVPYVTVEATVQSIKRSAYISLARDRVTRVELKF